MKMKINNIIIIGLLMFSFFLIVAGKNLPSSPPSPDVNFDAPPVQPTIPPPSPTSNIGDVLDDIEKLKREMFGLEIMLVITAILIFIKVCLGLFQT
ncbi:hypothetical protein QL285_030437 [Trifolium repens]|nr:hypothetical protein QL285_030437 [Trifolium repens]